MGDLKANPSKLLEKYFDAFVYVANWRRMISTFASRGNRRTNDSGFFLSNVELIQTAEGSQP